MARCILAPVAISLALGVPSSAQEVVTDGGIDYLTGDPATWPEELEATVAAPDNHKILLENEFVRVLEVTLAPGETEPAHFHRWPSVLYIQQAGDWIDRDADGNVIFDSREGPPLDLPLTLWKGPEAPHSPVNLSADTEIRLIRVEMKDVEAAPLSPVESDIRTVLDNRTAVILAGIASGNVAPILDLYTDDAVYSPSSDSLLTDRSALAEFWKAVADGPAADATLEVLSVTRLSPDAFMEVQKYAVFDARGERMFGGYASLLWRKVEGRWLIATDVSN